MRKWWILGLAVILVGYPLSQGTKNSVPNTGQLVAAARDADRIVVVPTPMTARPDRPDLPSIELHGEDRVTELLQQVDLIPPKVEMTFPGIVSVRGFACACDGDFHINLYRGESLRVSLGYQHGTHVRWRKGRWGTDVLLRKESLGRVPQWFHDHGYPHMKEYYAEREREQQQRP
jgi:hypothetical protein